jgi:hypothetical protein
VSRQNSTSTLEREVDSFFVGIACLLVECKIYYENKRNMLVVLAGSNNGNGREAISYLCQK